MSVAMLAQDFELGLRYILFAFLNFLALYLNRKVHRIIAFVFLGTMFLAYFLRGYLVALDYSLFTFSKLYEIDRSAVMWSFDTALLGTLFFIIGYTLTSFRVGRFTGLSPLAKSEKKFLLNNYWIVTGVVFLIILLKIILVNVIGTGLKGVESDSSVSFLLRLAPSELIFAILAVYLFKYRAMLTWQRQTVLLIALFGFSFSILATGSKAFVMGFALCYFIYLLYQNKKIPIYACVLLVALGGLTTAFSFAMSNAVKISYYVPNMTVKQVFDLSLELIKTESPREIFNHVTARFNGYDGQIKYLGLQRESERVDLEKLRYSYHPAQITMNAVDGLLPRVDMSSAPSTGVAVGHYAEKVRPGTPYAGSLGIVSAAMLISKKYYLLILLILGLCFGFVTKFVARTRHDDVKFILVFLVGFAILKLAMEGNFDWLIVDSIVKVAVLFFWILVISALAEFLIRIRGISAR